MDNIGINQILQKQQKLINQQEIIQTKIKQNTETLDKLSQPVLLAQEQVKQIGSNMFQSLINSDIIIYNGSKVVGRTNEQLNIQCNFDFRNAPYVMEDGYYKITQHSKNTIDLVAQNILMKNVILQVDQVLLKGNNQNVSVINCQNIKLNNTQFVSITNSKNISIDDSQNITIENGCENIIVKKNSGKEQGKIVFESECQNIVIGEKSAFSGGQIIFGNRCGYNGQIVFGNSCASYGGQILLEKQCGSEGGLVQFGNFCAAGCNEEFNNPYPQDDKIIVTGGIDGDPKGNYGGGKIRLGTGCASGPSTNIPTIILDDFCAYNVGNIVFGDRCASSLRLENSLGGYIQLGRCCAYAGQIIFGSRCSYDGESKIILGNNCGYNGDIQFGMACCYKGGNITMGHLCSGQGKIFLDTHAASLGGNIVFGNNCGYDSGYIRAGRGLAYKEGNVVFGDNCAAIGTITFGSFCGAFEGDVSFGKDCAFTGQINIADFCYNLTFGEKCGAEGKINIHEKCGHHGSISFGDCCGSLGGKIQVETMSAHYGTIQIGNNVAVSGGQLSFGANCVNKLYDYNGDSGDSGDSGLIVVGDNCAQNMGKIQIQDNVATNGGDVVIGNGCACYNASIIIGNNVAYDHGEIKIQDNCAIDAGKINIGTDCCSLSGKINIGNDCAQNTGIILIANKSAVVGGEIKIGNGCAQQGGIEIGYHCATGFFSETPNESKPGKIDIGNNCATRSGRIVVSMENCSSSSQNKNAGHISINDNCATNTGRLVIEAFCVTDGNHDGSGYVTGLIQIGEYCCDNGAILVCSRNVHNAILNIQDHCAINYGKINISSASILNGAHLLIKSYIASMESVVDIQQLRDNKRLIIGSDVTDINKELWKCCQICTKYDDSDIDIYRFWDFTLNFPSKQIQGMLFNVDSKFQGYYIENGQISQIYLKQQ